MNEQQAAWQKKIVELERMELVDEYNESLIEFKERVKLIKARLIFEQRQKVFAILEEVIQKKRTLLGFYGDGGKAERAREAKHSPFLITVKKRKEVRFETYQPLGVYPIKLPMWKGLGDQDHCVENKTDDIAKTAENTRYDKED